MYSIKKIEIEKRYNIDNCIKAIKSEKECR